MSKAVEADFEKTIRDYYAKSINMAKLLNDTFDQRDHYRNEGLCQNKLVKDLLEQNARLKTKRDDMERQLHAVEEARLNHQELYDIAAEEASKAVKAQQALERIIEHMEAEQLPQKLRLAKLQEAIQAKDEAMKLLEKNFQELSEDHQVINTLLSLPKVQLETSLQANKVLETRMQYATTSLTGSTNKEVELE